MTLEQIARGLRVAQEHRDQFPPHSPSWIALDGVVADWCRRLNEAAAA